MNAKLSWKWNNGRKGFIQLCNNNPCIDKFLRDNETGEANENYISDEVSF